MEIRAIEFPSENLPFPAGVLALDQEDGATYFCSLAPKLQCGAHVSIPDILYNHQRRSEAVTAKQIRITGSCSVSGFAQNALFDRCGAPGRKKVAELVWPAAIAGKVLADIRYSLQSFQHKPGSVRARREKPLEEFQVSLVERRERAGLPLTAYQFFGSCEHFVVRQDEDPDLLPALTLLAFAKFQ
jgi:hypothetical protein